jgi:hypothetical protein
VAFSGISALIFTRQLLLRPVGCDNQSPMQDCRPLLVCGMRRTPLEEANRRQNLGGKEAGDQPIINIFKVNKIFRMLSGPKERRQVGDRLNISFLFFLCCLLHQVVVSAAGFPSPIEINEPNDRQTQNQPLPSQRRKIKGTASHN